MNLGRLNAVGQNSFVNFKPAAKNEGKLSTCSKEDGTLEDMPRVNEGDVLTQSPGNALGQAANANPLFGNGSEDFFTTMMGEAGERPGLQA